MPLIAAVSSVFIPLRPANLEFDMAEIVADGVAAGLVLCQRNGRRALLRSILPGWSPVVERDDNPPPLAA